MRFHAFRGFLRTSCLAVLFAASGRGVHAQLPIVREAEDCFISCREGSALQETIWARGKVTPAFWGQAEGDLVRWRVTLKLAHRDLRFGLRYSYAGPSFEAHFPHNKERTLHLVVDGGKPIPVRVPSTGSWDEFSTVAVDLPRLSAGEHTLQVVSPARFTTTNIDTLILFKGPLEKLPAQTVRTTVAVSPSKRFVLRATPNAPFPLTPKEIFAGFERIHAHYLKTMGWAPTDPIPINLIEDARWPDPGATAFQNGGGVYFRAGAMATEQGNWMHEMTHMFYLAHFPRWFDEPSVRALTTLVWAPALYPPAEGQPKDRAYTAAVAEGAAVLASPDAAVGALEPVLHALFVRYGAGFYERFFHACVEAGAKGEIDFRPGRWMTRDEIVRMMSRAAKEDVTPLLRRWNGFEGAE